MSALTRRTRTPTVAGEPFFDPAGFDSAAFGPVASLSLCDRVGVDAVAGARISVILRHSCGILHAASLLLRHSYDQGLGDFHLAVLEGVDECVDHDGIEVCACTGDDDLPGFEWGDGAAIGAVD